MSKTTKDAAPVAEAEEGGTAYVNATAFVINHNGRTVAPGGVLCIGEMSLKDKGLMHLIETGGLSPQK